MNGRDVLMGTRRLFTAGQWTRGSFRRKREGEPDLYCLVGGLRHVAYGSPLLERRSDHAYREAKLALATTLGYDLIYFNDHQDSPEPVIAAIDQAVALIDERDEKATRQTA